MDPDDLLCSRNARPPKALVGRAQWEITQSPPLKKKRASVEGSSVYSLDARTMGPIQTALNQVIRGVRGGISKLGGSIILLVRHRKLLDIPGRKNDQHGNNS